MSEPGLLQRRYDAARQAKVGSEIRCPVCDKAVTKTAYQKVFCTSVGPGNCKDRFWNTTDETRRGKAA